MELLIAFLNALKLEGLAEKLEKLNDALDADLADIESELLRLFDEIKAGVHAEILGDGTVATAQELAAAVRAVQELAATRIDAVTELAAAIDAIELERPVAEEPVASDVEPEPVVEAVEEPAAEPEPVVEDEPEAVVEPEKVLVASVRPNLAALAPKRPAPAPVTETRPEWVGPNGQAVKSYADADALLIETFNNTVATAGVVAKIPVMSRRRESFGEDRQLLAGQDGANAEKMQAMVASVQHETVPGMIAAGFCAPAQGEYDQPTLGVEARPVFDTHPHMELSRGRVTIGAAPVLADILVDEADAAITNLTSAEITGGSTKTVQCFVACPTPTTTSLEETAIRLCFSDWQEFSWAERNAAITKLSQVSAARQKELRLLGLIDAGSVYLSQAAVLGTLRDVLAVVDQLVTQERTRLRDDSVRFRALFPSTLWARMRTDILRAMNSEIGMIDVAEATLRAAFETRGVNVTVELDSEVYAAQAGTVGGPGETAIASYNGTMVWRLYPEGTWSVGTGPEMRLGVIRDATRVGQNRFETFDASWETMVRFGGWPSFRINQTVCENGTSSGTVDLSALCTGS